MRLVDTVEVKQNLIITARERGKIMARREGHNIWLDLGREYLAQLISLSSYDPDVPFTNNRIKYMGFGIGGTRQLMPNVANSAPISPPYSGTNTQTDTDATVTTLERPVRVSGSTANYPGLAGDQWIGRIGAADPTTIPTQTTFRRTFTQLEISYGPFTSVPLSEVGLLNAGADPENFLNTLVAFDTFDSLSKTVAFDLEVEWTIRLG
jgi:hypothetical protein